MPREVSHADDMLSFFPQHESLPAPVRISPSSNGCAETFMNLPADWPSPTNDRAVYRAVASVFVRVSLQPSAQSFLRSRDVLDRCKGWCDKQRLFNPSPHEIAEAMRLAGYLPHKSNGQRLWRGGEWLNEPDPFLALAEPDVLRRLTHANPVFPLRVFCELAGIGRSTFYALAARGEAPPSYRLGRRVFITAKDAVVWCSERGQHASVLAIVDRVEDRRASIERTRNRARG